MNYRFGAVQSSRRPDRKRTPRQPGLPSSPPRAARRRRTRGILALPVAAALASGPASSAPSDLGALEAKARHFRRALIERHRATEGVVLYRVDLRSLEQDLAAGRYANLADTPTFTGQLAAAACTRADYETGAAREEALEDASDALRGLEFLMDVTGVRGLLARGIRRGSLSDPPVLHGRRFRGAARFQDYVWRGDVSMDQYANGLLPAVAACRSRFPDRTRRLITDTARHLLENDMRLVDPDGRPTRFGDLSWRSGLGLNSLAQLTGYGVFALAADLHDDPRWKHRRDRLRDRWRVVARSRRTNVRVLGVTNHSNDLMAWSLYRVLVPLARATRDPALRDLRHGMHRAWLRVRPDGNAYFTFVLCQIEPAACDASALADALDQLRRFPLEKRRLAPDPALAKLPRRWLPGRKGHPLARGVVPIELRPVSSFEWKSSPYRLEGGASPHIEFTGLDYLAAYWLYRSLHTGVPELLGKGVKRDPGLPIAGHARRGASRHGPGVAGPGPGRP